MYSIIWILCCFVVCVKCQNEIVFRIPEERELGYFVGNILETSAFTRTDLRFSLMSQGNAFESFFSLDENNGNLTTAQVIDRELSCAFEEVCEFVLEIAAQSTNNDGFFDVLRVKVVIDDVNDNVPTFSTSDRVHVDISEASLIGTPKTIEKVRDGDKSTQFSIKSCEILPFRPTDLIPFDIECTKTLDGSSLVQLIVSRELNREQKDSYAFYAVAKDGGDPPLNGTLYVNVTILDFNDNYPVFDNAPYNVTVREDVQVNTVILTLRATDADDDKNGDVRYKLSQNQIRENLQKFAIHETSGELSIRETLQYKTNGYKIIVEAVDQAPSPLTTQTYVQVNVLDTGNDPPQIYVNLLTGLNHAVASEYANIGAVVAHVTVTDQDTDRNGDVSCNVISDWFSLQRYDDNEFKVIVSASLNRERFDRHNVTVRCYDKGTPPMGTQTSFIVKILDENDNAPRFSQTRYFADIFENNGIGDIILSLYAFDQDSGDNGKITYKVSSESTKYVFVNPETGDVMANCVFDRENMTGVNVTVYAEDNGSPMLRGSTLISLTIKDENDHTPIFTETSFRRWVGENLPSDTVVGHVTANDSDEGVNGMITYKLKHSNTVVPFVVFDNGLIKTNREFDRESKSEYTFEVIATDRGLKPLSSSALVTVFVEDANDNEPKIHLPTPGNDTVLVPYLTSPMTVIFKVIATDDDEPDNNNSRLSYSIATLNTTNFFSIDSSTGDITLVAPLSNADLIDKVYVLNITVKDVSDHPLSDSAFLRVLITSDNATASAVTEEQSVNFIIAIVVLSITIVIAAAIIGTICVLHRMDKRRQKSNARQKVLSDNMYSKNIQGSNDFVDGGFHFPMDNSFQEKKKKEVSFSLDDGLMETSAHAPGDILSHHDDDLDRILKVGVLFIYFLFRHLFLMG